MYYIEKRFRGRRWDFTLIHILPTLVVCLALLGITLISKQSALQANENQRKELISREVIDINNQITARVNTYQDTLRAAAGLLSTSNNVSRTDWRQFIANFELEKRYPGVLGVGFSEIFQPSEIAAHEAAVRADGFPNYGIRPAGQRNIYSAVKLMEPSVEHNVQLLGADMLVEPNRKAAMELARDSGVSTITSIVTLERDNQSPQTGFLMYAPVYKHGSANTTSVQRRSNIEGFAFAPFRTGELFENIFKDMDQNYGLKIYDGNLPNESSLLYETSSFNRISKFSKSETLVKQLKVNNVTWTIAVNEHPNVISARERSRPTAILWLGSLFSVLTAGLIYMLLAGRTRSLAHKDEQTIQDAKDELLALASHQLRTPATGVKQYVGMLLEGYGGKLSITQRKLLDKAYDSNERQLSTINDMLFIARVDAGEMKLEYETVNITQMLNDVISEQMTTIKERGHKLKTEFLSHPVIISADKKYLRMAVENIVNNATKYTPDGGEISVSTREKQSIVEISIADSGVGVERKDYPLLFRKFSRIPNELTRKVSGSGIGLYLAKQVVDAHGGSIRFSSKPDEGSKFLIVLPKRRHSRSK